ncbi:hypothetical protein [Micromonospora sp. NPDC049679]|uniref:hypothetical protein n=1 Tax=Micromonospora sp. NPDC049679 TaxID=3155920 RepID=UPI0033DC727C
MSDDSGAVTLPTRRVLRWAAVIGAFILTVLLCWQDPGYAHDGLRVTIHQDGRGSVWVDVAWQDGHPVTGPIGATFSAREFGGTTVAATDMHPVPTKGSMAYAGTLPAGNWTVSVDVTAPGRGSCAAVLAVGPAAPPESVSCDAGPAPAVLGAGGTERTRDRWLMVTAAAVGLVVAAGVAATLVRRRRRTLA